jgi:hypothetical protein
MGFLMEKNVVVLSVCVPELGGTTLESHKLFCSFNTAAEVVRRCKL